MMAKGHFKTVLAITLKHEGGFVDHPRDPGGATNKGITIGTFRRYRPNATVADLKAISDADVERIYRDGYWSPVAGDMLARGVDLAVFDYAVNSGVGRAARHLQGVVGVNQDGTIGPMTLRAIEAMRGDELIRKLCARRLSFVRGLRTWDAFGKGWARRIADVEARGVAMWLGMNATVQSAKMGLEDQADRAGKVSGAQTKGAVGAGGAGAGGGAMDVSIDPSVILIGAAALIVIGGFLFLKGRVNRYRAEAYRAAASGVRA